MEIRAVQSGRPLMLRLWLELDRKEFLKTWEKTVVVVSHDRPGRVPVLCCRKINVCQPGAS